MKKKVNIAGNKLIKCHYIHFAVTTYNHPFFDSHQGS